MALKKCNECGEQISGSAKACPKCGKPQTSRATKLIALLFIIAVGGAIIFPSSDEKQKTVAVRPAPETKQQPAVKLSPEEEAKRSADEEAARKKEAAERAEKMMEEARSLFGWKSGSYIDSVSGKKIYQSQARSINSFELGSPYKGQQRALLVARNHPRWGKNIFISVEKGQLICDFDNCNVSVRFDDGSVSKYKVTKPSDHSSDTLFISNHDGFVSNLVKSKQVYIELTFFREGTRTVTFMTDGFVRPSADTIKD